MFLRGVVMGAYSSAIAGLSSSGGPLLFYPGSKSSVWAAARGLLPFSPPICPSKGGARLSPLTPKGGRLNSRAGPPFFLPKPLRSVRKCALNADLMREKDTK